MKMLFFTVFAVKQSFQLNLAIFWNPYDKNDLIANFWKLLGTMHP
jgi:hypothetical protein